MTGTIRPSSSATATPMCTRLNRRTCPSLYVALMAGCRWSARAVALMMMSLTLSFSVWASMALSDLRSSSAAPMSASTVTVKWGMGALLWVMRAAMVLRMRLSSLSSNSRSPAGTSAPPSRWAWAAT